jgi:hypothetical protein
MEPIGSQQYTRDPVTQPLPSLCRTTKPGLQLPAQIGRVPSQ